MVSKDNFHNGGYFQVGMFIIREMPSKWFVQHPNFKNLKGK